MNDEDENDDDAGGDGTAPVRLDKWLWAARFYKTRALAVEQIDKGRVQVNGQAAKPARALRAGDLVVLWQSGVPRTVRVLGLSAQRGPAPVAQRLYTETPESVAQREQLAQARRDGVEPALTLAQGRPTKRDRRARQQVHDWNARWSASLDDAEPG